MLANEVLQNIPDNCLCEVSELPNQVKGGNVKSYGVTVECDNCRIKRELQNIENTKQRRKQEILQKLSQLDLKAIRPLIDKEEAKIQEIKAEKDLLRVKLNTL